MKKINKKISFEAWLKENTFKILGVCDTGGLNIMFTPVKKDLTSDLTPHGTIVFSIKCVKIYKMVYISYYPMAQKLYKERNTNTLFIALTHEIAHIYSNPLTELALQRFGAKKNIIEANEELTESIGMLIRKLLK